MESPHEDPTTPGGRACDRVCVSDCLGRRGVPSWAGRQGRQEGREDRKAGRTARHTEQGGQLPTLPTPPTLPRFPPFPRVSYCQQERHTRIPQNGLLSSHFTIPRLIKTLHTDTQRLTCRLNIISIICGRFTAPKR